MDRTAVIATLREHEAELKKLGILHAGLFGSLARGEAGPQSDIDIAVDLDDAMVRDIYSYVGVQRHIAALFEGRVDVVDQAALKSDVRDSVALDLVYAF